MDNAKIDSKHNTVTVEGGIKNTQLYNYISTKGYPFPGGTCPTVGVSGHAGGGNFGVITSMTFNLPPKVNKVTYVRIRYLWIDRPTQVKILDTWQKWIASVDNDINLSGGLYHTKEEGVYAYFRGISYKNIEETTKLLEPFNLINGVEITLEEDLYINIINKIASSYPSSEHFKSTGRFVNRYYYLDELSNLVDIINQELPPTVT